MSAQSPTTPNDEPHETDEPLDSAYTAIEQALRALQAGAHTDQYEKLQRRYFDLRAAILARSDEFQNVSLDGRTLYMQGWLRPGDSPDDTANHDITQWPMRSDSVTVLDSVTVCDPDNPHLLRHVRLSHIVDTDGTVQVRIDSTPLEELP